MTPAELRAWLHHQAQLATEQGASSAPCSPRQAQFLASLWQSALPGNASQRRDSYHLCLAWLWGVDSANSLSITEASLSIDWLLGGQPRTATFPIVCPVARATSLLILAEMGYNVAKF